MKTHFLLLAILCSLVSFGQAPKTYNVTLTEPGTVLNYVDLNSIALIEVLTVSGEINKIDIDAIKKMPNLKILNIQNAKIIVSKNVYENDMQDATDEYNRAINGIRNWGKVISPQHMQKIKNKMNYNIARVNELHETYGILESGSFSHFISLEKIYLPTNIQEIRKSAFEKCVNLKEIFFPSKLKKLESNVFLGCSNLLNINFPPSLSEAGIRVFKDCSKLKRVTFSSDIKEIGHEFFRGCTDLNAITFQGVNTINESFVIFCDSLKVIYCYSENPPKVEEAIYVATSYSPNRKDITFYCPAESVTAYFGSKWAEFFTLSTF